MIPDEPIRGQGPVIRILLVDDERSFVNTLSKRLAVRGVEATKAYSGKEGIQALRRQDFDAAVLDLKLEDMNGVEVLKIMRIMAPEMPIIMLTGHGSDQTLEECLNAGAMECLTKPYMIDDLVEKIRSAVGARGPGAPTP